MILLRGSLISPHKADPHCVFIYALGLSFLFVGRFDLVDALHDYAKSVTLHGDDVLAHGNWEIGEKWIRQYGCVIFYHSFLSRHWGSHDNALASLARFLVDAPVLNICNRWRRERGEKEIALHELSNAQDLPATT